MAGLSQVEMRAGVGMGRRRVQPADCSEPTGQRRGRRGIGSLSTFSGGSGNIAILALLAALSQFLSFSCVNTPRGFVHCGLSVLSGRKSLRGKGLRRRVVGENSAGRTWCLGVGRLESGKVGTWERGTVRCLPVRAFPSKPRCCANPFPHPLPPESVPAKWSAAMPCPCGIVLQSVEFYPPHATNAASRSTIPRQTASVAFFFVTSRIGDSSCGASHRTAGLRIPAQSTSLLHSGTRLAQSSCSAFRSDLRQRGWSRVDSDARLSNSWHCKGIRREGVVTRRGPSGSALDGISTTTAAFHSGAARSCALAAACGRDGLRRRRDR